MTGRRGRRPLRKGGENMNNRLEKHLANKGFLVIRLKDNLDIENISSEHKEDLINLLYFYLSAYSLHMIPQILCKVKMY